MTAAAVLHRAPTRLLIIVCLYTACVTFKPSEPFLVAFLECFKGISHADVMYKVFPVWTYSYLVLLLPLAASAELIGHRQVVLLGASARCVTTVLLLLPMSTCSVGLMQLSQVCMHKVLLTFMARTRSVSSVPLASPALEDLPARTSPPGSTKRHDGASRLSLLLHLSLHLDCTGHHRCWLRSSSGVVCHHVPWVTQGESTPICTLHLAQLGSAS